MMTVKVVATVAFGHAGFENDSTLPYLAALLYLQYPT
jgi:hypothetical protein